ncbi:N-acetylmuramoyl-L-alanine amidase [Caldinitratiruptor microaerophilus]|uniref:Sporulation-specific N-acetylmuramoyl-L-alanine amidase n=1 Tax=Caldinitratiruptor microaerophilus TaxID=671077 RepID=A0AA35G7A1_9FIRM|nr:N-acetylmuramoyl-L-alanine amidase [Caldinitratiruptor microaerophilus]BDG59615.1 sporulation-specific N-acetylmuramoyl-L-alanine amidase [Caldinitratiruptor microaerophilus]
MPKPLVCLDPGHGGADPGAAGNSLAEKDLALDLALRIREELLSGYHVDVLMTRETDTFVSLADRARMANDAGADYFHSVHLNAFEPSARGYEDFVHTSVRDDGRAARIRAAVHEAVMELLTPYGVPDRGYKRADFFVLRETAMPAVLTENLFVTNEADAGLLRQELFRQALARAHVRGIARGLGLQPVARPPVLYKVQVGAFTQRENAERLAAELRDKGYSVYIVRTSPD